MIFTLLWQTVAAVGVIIVMTRIHGLRSFSKMSGFDFAITVAMGSVLAAAATTPDNDFGVTIIALLTLFAIQMATARIRGWSDVAQQTIDNAPLLVMRGHDIDDDTLGTAGMTRSDLWGKLREANAFDLDTVLAVIVEPTGDVSVLHGEGGFDAISPEVLEGVRGA